MGIIRALNAQKCIKCFTALDVGDYCKISYAIIIRIIHYTCLLSLLYLIVSLGQSFLQWWKWCEFEFKGQKWFHCSSRRSSYRVQFSFSLLNICPWVYLKGFGCLFLILECYSSRIFANLHTTRINKGHIMRKFCSNWKFNQYLLIFVLIFCPIS